MTITPEPTGAYLRDLLGIDFTEHQLAIATHDLCPQLVVAGAGAGKTMVMAARVVHAVACQGVAPGRILGLTFTNKAAGELGARVRAALATLARARAGIEQAEEAAADHGDLPTVATYHAYAASLVRDHALRIGREPYATLLTEASRWQLAMRVTRRATGPFPHLDWTTPSVAGKALALAGEIAEHLVDLDAVRRVDRRVKDEVAAMTASGDRLSQATHDAAKAAASREELLELVAAYAAEKERLDLIDYGDQVALAARIAAQAPAVGSAERGRFGLVVLDEYQDTGVAQRLLLSTLFGGGHPVVAVGDPNQAIYGWRGASVGNLLRFGEHFPRADGRPVAPQPLMTSFRCGGRILDAANAIAAQLGADRPRRARLEVERLAPDTSLTDTGSVVLARLETDRDEAAWMAERIAGELAAGTPPGEVAVLARRRADFQRLHAALVDRDVPVEVVGLGGLLEMPEVADVVAVLSLLVEPTANAAAIRLLTGPRWRLGVRDLAALGNRARHLATWTPPDDGAEPPVGGDLQQALQQVTASVDPVDVAALLDAVEHPGSAADYSPEAWERLAAFRSEIVALRRLVGQPLVELVTEVVRTIGLDVEIEAQVEGVAAARAANLAAFLDHAAAFTGLEGESDLPAFLAYLVASADVEDGLDVGVVSAANTVKLMTVHKAKGLEWDVVAVPGAVDGVFPSTKSRTSWIRGAHVLPFELRGDADDLPHLTGLGKVELEAFSADCRAEALDEERRLAYVAFTRPRRLLLVSGYCWAGTRQKPCPVSPYLDELRALDEPAVRVDRWCDDPVDGTNPLIGAATADLPWPAPVDAAELRRRRAAAGLVRQAITDLASKQTAIELPAAGGRLSWGEEARLVVDELHRESGGVREVPLPRRLTASQVVLLAQDPDELARMLARPLPARPQPQARRGSRFHAWVEGLYGATPLLEPDDLPGAGDADLTDDELRALQERFLADGWGDRRPVAVEQAFELVVGGRLLRGRIDAVYPGAAGGFDVIDYKTGAVPRDFAAAALQLSIYRLAWADLAGVEPDEVDAGFLYVRTGELKRPTHLLSRAELAGVLSGEASA